MAVEPTSCKTVRMGVVSWTDVVATSGMADVLLNGLGYDSKQTSAVQQIIFAGIRDKRLDIFLGYWKPAMDNNIAPFLAARQVKVFDTPSLADAQATLAVPQYVADAGLKTFADIARFKDQLGGKIYGIKPGSGANTDIQKMIDTNHFDLGGFKRVASGEAGMLAAVPRAVNRKEFVVFVGWPPPPMNINMQMAYLTGSEDVFGPDEGRATVSTVTRVLHPRRRFPGGPTPKLRPHVPGIHPAETARAASRGLHPGRRGRAQLSACSSATSRWLLYIHGGGWVVGGLDSHDFICFELASRLNVLVIAIDYRLAPEYPFPAAYEDFRVVWRAIQAGEGLHAVNPQRLVVMGDSAGGNLAAALCLGLRDDGMLYAERLQAAGVATRLYPGKGLIHGCLRARRQAPEVDRLFAYLLGYLHGELLTPV